MHIPELVSQKCPKEHGASSEHGLVQIPLIQVEKLHWAFELQLPPTGMRRQRPEVASHRYPMGQGLCGSQRRVQMLSTQMPPGQAAWSRHPMPTGSSSQTPALHDHAFGQASSVEHPRVQTPSMQRPEEQVP